jgi:hypothetical protein
MALPSSSHCLSQSFKLKKVLSGKEYKECVLLLILDAEDVHVKSSAIPSRNNTHGKDEESVEIEVLEVKFDGDHSHKGVDQLGKTVHPYTIPLSKQVYKRVPK